VGVVVFKNYNEFGKKVKSCIIVFVDFYRGNAIGTLNAPYQR
jgi:hypothetical protein